MKKKTLLTSLLTLVMCVSLIAGGTFALATSNSQVNVAVQAGTVKVVATLGNMKTFSAQANADNTGYDEVEQTEGKFVNGGTAKIENGTLTLDRMIHGDKVTFDIVFDNQSNIDVKYQTIIQTVEDTGLFAGLEVTIDGQTFNGFTAVSDWNFLKENTPLEKSTWSCSVSLPIDADTSYQGASTKLSVSVNAVQGNAIVSNPDSDAINIYNATDLRSFANNVNNGNTYKDKQVVLHNDIDLENKDWTPIGYAVIANNDYDFANSPHFAGSFDGQGHTISNLYVNEPQTNIRGLFGYGKITSIKNLNIHNASITGLRRSAVLVGQNDAQMIVDNVNITGDIKIEVIRNEAGTVVGRGGHDSISNVTVNASEGSYVKCSTTSSATWEYVGGVWGHAWPTAKNITSNIDVYAYASSTGGIGGGCATSSDNIVCSGNVTMTIKDSEIHKGTIECWQTNGTIYGFGVGSSNTASHNNASATGTLTMAGEVITDNMLNGLATGYPSNDVRFGAPYNFAGVLIIDGKASTSSSSNLSTLLNTDGVKTVTLTGGNFSDVISVPNEKELVVENVALNTSAGYGIGISAGANSNLILNGGSFTAYEMAHVIDAQAKGSKVTVNGGSYEGNFLFSVDQDATAIVNDCTFATESYPATAIAMTTSDNITANITINGGTFYSDAICNNFIKINITGGIFYLNSISNSPTLITKEHIIITGGTFSVDPTAYLADGYTATQNGDSMWVVSAN